MPWKHRFWLLEKQHSGTKNVSYLNSFCFVLLIVFLFIKAIFCFFYLVFLVKSHIYLCQWHSVILSYYHANRAKFQMLLSLTLTGLLTFGLRLTSTYNIFWHWISNLNTRINKSTLIWENHCIFLTKLLYDKCIL